MTPDARYMMRCLQLAGRAAGYVAPNPMVGAVLVHGDRIIGEGYHHRFGQAHAEVNCLASVRATDQPLIPASTLYVSLEPCAHFGKTPPCTDLIIRRRIPRVVIGCRDPFDQVDGRGMDQLRAAGVEVVTGILEEASRDRNRRFITFHTRRRPYVILKWAQSADGRIGAAGTRQLRISQPLTDRLVHRWRSEEAAILVGTETARSDDPQLTNRLWNGPSPVRVVVDRRLRLPPGLRLFDGSQPTVVLNDLKSEGQIPLVFHRLAGSGSAVSRICSALYELQLQSVLVEGGARLLQSFLDEGTWDEIRIITGTRLRIPGGIPAPTPGPCQQVSEYPLGEDRITVLQPLAPPANP
ncbi:MAG TPA: bifunctional diaminohydroxyphosphoribosylaminopyrimidine deaminase/5-amino-6-(5-phosphoribosylamino)uracil reductase RibD [Chitinophagaceae bacterium]|nr:bifunctional diaminohydroxyphosphoribosylaminopyrimidine deaminase/5-amino-6-(5-phosphoribosylamino)uracil reductase RibD [Chitinophagaceae bacterium]